MTTITETRQYCPRVERYVAMWCTADNVKDQLTIIMQNYFHIVTLLQIHPGQCLFTIVGPTVI